MADNFLTRAQIDEILSAMTTRDLFAAFPEGVQVSGADIAGRVFEKAAERAGHGAEALDRVTIADGIYLAGALGEKFADGPKDAATKASRTSRASGG